MPNRSATSGRTRKTQVCQASAPASTSAPASAATARAAQTSLDAHIDRLLRKALADQVTQKRRKAPRREHVVCYSQFVERPPAHLVDVLESEVEPGRGLEGVDAHEVDALRLPAPRLAHLRKPVVPPPDAWSELVAVQPELLRELASQDVLVELSALGPAAWHRPHAVGIAHEDRASGGVEDDRSHRRPERQTGGAARQLLEPALPLRPGDGGVRRRRGREDEVPRLADAALLEAELRAFAEGAAIGLLPDERQPARAQLERDPLEPLGRVGEVAAPQVAGSLRRPVGGVGQADAVR